MATTFHTAEANLCGGSGLEEKAVYSRVQTIKMAGVVNKREKDREFFLFLDRL